MVKEFGMDMHTLLYFKWITEEDLMYSSAMPNIYIYIYIYIHTHTLIYRKLCPVLCCSLDERRVWGRMGTCVWQCPFPVRLKLSQPC